MGWSGVGREGMERLRLHGFRSTAVKKARYAE